MDTRIIVEHFNPKYHNLDQNDEASFLGGGAFGRVYKATQRDGLRNRGLPEEIAVKCMKWKLPGKGYEETENNLIDVGLNFANDNLVQIFAISMTKTEIARTQRFKIQHIFMELCEESLEDFIKEKTD